VSAQLHSSSSNNSSSGEVGVPSESQPTTVGILKKPWRAATFWPQSSGLSGVIDSNNADSNVDKRPETTPTATIAGYRSLKKSPLAGTPALKRKAVMVAIQFSELRVLASPNPQAQLSGQDSNASSSNQSVQILKSILLSKTTESSSKDMFFDDQSTIHVGRSVSGHLELSADNPLSPRLFPTPSIEAFCNGENLLINNNSGINGMMMVNNKEEVEEVIPTNTTLEFDEPMIKDDGLSIRASTAPSESKVDFENRMESDLELGFQLDD